MQVAVFEQLISERAMISIFFKISSKLGKRFVITMEIWELVMRSGFVLINNESIYDQSLSFSLVLLKFAARKKQLSTGPRI